MRVDVNTDVQQVVESIKDRNFTNIFLVACGGSLSIMYPAKYFCDRNFNTIDSDLYNADEFICRSPRKLGANALVILCSQTGTTRETVAAAKFAREKGATTIVMTLDGSSALAREGEFVLSYNAPYTTGLEIDPYESNYAVLYMLLGSLLAQRENVDLTGKLLASLGNLPAVTAKAKQSFAPMFAEFAQRFHDKNVIYTTGSGCNYGAAYSFAICVLMEMQWINSQAIHANEFFHGPFEVVDENTCFISLIGMDETRRLEERNREFLNRFGNSKNIMVLDAAELDLEGIDSEFQGYLVPLIFFDALWVFVYQLAELRGQIMLDGRRYMKKIFDY